MKGLRHTGIVVKDLEAALHFYRDLLGFKIVTKMEESGKYIDMICGMKNIKITTVKLAADDNNLIELLYFLSPPSKNVADRKLNEIGFSHIALTVKDIDKMFISLKRKGVEFLSPPQVSSDGKAKVSFCKDFEGNFLELVQKLD